MELVKYVLILSWHTKINLKYFIYAFVRSETKHLAYIALELFQSKDKSH